MTAPADVETAASRGQDQLRSRNPHEWVGVGHNKMLDDFRRELRQVGMLTRNICEYVTSFSMQDDRVPLGRPRGSDGNWRALRVVVDSAPLCSSSHRKYRLSSLGFGAPMAGLAPRLPQAPTTESLVLLGEIENSVAVAADGSDLANRLSGTFSRAQSLPEIDRVVIEATISVALNSFVYWQAQYHLFEQEMVAEYAPCIEEQLAIGVTDGITEACLTGKGSGGAVAAGPSVPPKQRLVRARSRRQCGPKLGEGFRKIGHADLRGAFLGGFSGALAGGVVGAGAGALAGGGGNSIFAAGENAWQTLKCMYGMT